MIWSDGVVREDRAGRTSAEAPLTLWAESFTPRVSFAFFTRGHSPREYRFSGTRHCDTRAAVIPNSSDKDSRSSPRSRRITVWACTVTMGGRDGSVPRSVVGHANSQRACHESDSMQDECKAVAKLRRLPIPDSTDRAKEGLPEVVPAL